MVAESHRKRSFRGIGRFHVGNLMSKQIIGDEALSAAPATDSSGEAVVATDVPAAPVQSKVRADGRVTRTPEAPDECRTDTCTAIALGWQTAALYLNTGASGSDEGADDLAPELSGRGSLKAPRRAAARQLGVGVMRLEPLLAGVGLPLPVIDQAGNLDSLTPTEFKKRVADFNEVAIEMLTAADYRVGKGYTLGRKLANMAMTTPIYDPQWTQAEVPDVRQDLDKICGWIDALRSVLPDHAAKPVFDGIDHWKAWLVNPIRADKAPCQQASDSPLDADVLAVVTTVLGLQVRVWRGLLTGEKSALDFLSSKDYVASAEQMVTVYRRIVWGFVRQWWRYLAAGTTALTGIIAIPLIFAQGTAGALGALVATLAAVGVTGKTVSATLSRTVGNVAHSLMNAELDTASGMATTGLPFGVNSDQLKPLTPLKATTGLGPS